LKNYIHPKKIKVLLITLSKNSYGGVVEYNNGVLVNSNCNISSFSTTSGFVKSNFLKFFVLFFDVIRLISILSRKKIELVHVNPSLSINSFIRDAMFVFVAKLFNKKIFVQWHGWNPKNEFLLKGIFLKILKISFMQAEHTSFLYNELKMKYLALGYKNNTSISSTFISKELVGNMGERKRFDSNVELLFLSTVSINKGIYKAVELFLLLKKINPNLVLTIAGKGPELNNVKERYEDEVGIKFKGYVKGKEKVKLLEEADIYLFPSEYEGMPISILEAMYFGLPVITTRVGAIKDFFIDHKMGYSCYTNNFVDIQYNNLSSLILDTNLRKKMSDFNKNFAKDNYSASKVISKLDSTYTRIVNENKV
jgi:glycosyltransferase involved in cell wall biosynthesis